MAEALEPGVVELARGPNFCAYAGLRPDGSPFNHILWVDCDDEHVVVNTEVHRAKAKWADQEPRVAVVIWDASDPYHYAEIRGQVVERVTGEEARTHIDALSNKYTGKDYDPDAIKSERVMLKIAPTRQRVY